MEEIPLILKNIRVHGYGDVIDSMWIEVGKGLTLFALPPDFNRKGFLQALQTINPPYTCQEKNPFSDYPSIARQGKYQKRVRANRRTIAFAIFTAQPRFVLELAKLTPHLYETDRIEVGRRLNYSRWVNFVEIASSTRWEEIYEKVEVIAAGDHDSVPPWLSNTLRSLKKTDRVKNELQKALSLWLRRLSENEKNVDQKKQYEELIFTVERQLHFDQAKDMVKACLPRFYLFDSEWLLEHYGTAVADIELAEIVKHANVFIEQEGNRGDMVPLLLFDEPDLISDRASALSLRRFAQDISNKFQCIYLVSDETPIDTTGDAKIITLEEMLAE